MVQVKQTKQPKSKQSKHSLASIDKKIADLVALIAFYEALHLALISIGEGPVPTQHEHLIVCLRDQGKTTFAKDVSKSILKHVGSVIDAKAVPKRTDLRADIVHEIRQLKAKFDVLVATRQSMYTVVENAQVETIIKRAQKEPTVAKARASVKKSAQKHGLMCNETIKEYLD